MAYIEWFKRKVLKKVDKNQIDVASKGQLDVLVKGCGKNIPNDIKEKDQCFTWWFSNGNWKESKKNNWRVGCNWGSNGTSCGFQYSDGANYCQTCGKQI